jgi:hypothetical protein
MLHHEAGVRQTCTSRADRGRQARSAPPLRPGEVAAAHERWQERQRRAAGQRICEARCALPITAQRREVRVHGLAVCCCDADERSSAWLLLPASLQAGLSGVAQGQCATEGDATTQDGAAHTTLHQWQCHFSFLPLRSVRSVPRCTNKPCLSCASISCRQRADSRSDCCKPGGAGRGRDGLRQDDAAAAVPAREPLHGGPPLPRPLQPAAPAVGHQRGH